MNIIIVGCGKIGSTLAEQLNNEGHDITIVDKNENVLRNVATKLDVMGVTGNGAMLDVQMEAGIRNADLLIAVTGSDELNMLCCLIAKQESHANTIARIRNPEYEREIDFFKEELNISMVINPEKMVAHDIVRLIRFPTAREVETFSQGQVDMVKIRLTESSALCGLALKDMSSLKLKVSALICCVERGNEVIIPSGNTVLQAGDLVSFIAKPTDAILFCKVCNEDYVPVKTAFLVGGGRIAHYVARYVHARKNHCELKLIEINPEKCRDFADNFPDMTVINGDGSSQQLLIEEGIETADAFVAMTGIDEENIITSLFASKLSKARLITKVNHLQTSDIDDLQVGSVVSPRTATASSVVRYVRGLEGSMGSNLETLYKIANGKAEACEFLVHKDARLIHIPLMKLNLRKNVLIAAIIRNGKVISPGGSDFMEEGDRVVVMTTNKGIRELRDILA